MNTPANKTLRIIHGFTTVELMIVLAIVVTLAGLFIANLSGVKSKDKLDTASQLITNDLLQIRSLALTTNLNHRIRFLTVDTWQIERYTGSAWTTVTAVRRMPSDTYLTSASFSNAGSNLESTPRGLYTFGGSSTGTPYVTISGTNVSQTRSINVYVGGAVEKTTP